MVHFGCLEEPLSKLFYVYGCFIARHPVWFIVCPLLLAAALGSGILRFKSEYDVEKLYAPEGARSKDERSILENLYPSDEDSEHFSPMKLSILGQYVRVIVTTKKKGGNVLTDDVINDVKRLDSDIRNISIDLNGVTYTYEQLCAGSCRLDPLLSLHSAPLQVDLTKLSYPVHWTVVPVQTQFGPVFRNVSFYLGNTIGGVTTTTGGDTEAEAWSMWYFVKSGEDHIEASLAWQWKFLSTVAEKDYKHITVMRYSARSLKDELQRNARDVIPLIAILVVLLATFSVVSCMSTDCVRSKPLLGVLGVFSAIIAEISSFGLVLLFGIPFVDIVASNPFLILGMLLCIFLVKVKHVNFILFIFIILYNL